MTTSLDFRRACYTAIFMILLSTGLAVTAVLTAHRVHDVQMSTLWLTVWQSHGTQVVLLAVFGCTVLIWMMILVWIHAYWPDGWIYQRRKRKMQDGGGDGGGNDKPEELMDRAQSMGHAGPAPAYTRTGDEERQ
jgi:hypothetical protein